MHYYIAILFKPDYAVGGYCLTWVVFQGCRCYQKHKKIRDTINCHWYYFFSYLILIRWRILFTYAGTKNNLKKI